MSAGLGYITSVVQRKGGASKTFTSIHVALELASRDFKVSILDGDNEQHASTFVSNSNIPNLTSIPEVNEDNLVESIRKAKADGADFIIVDTPGGLSNLASQSISVSHYVIIPVMFDTKDARSGLKTAQVIQEVEEKTNRKIHHGILYSNVRAIGNSVEEEEVLALLNEYAPDVDRFNARFVNKPALKACESKFRSITQMQEYYQECIDTRIDPDDGSEIPSKRISTYKDKLKQLSDGKINVNNIVNELLSKIMKANKSQDIKEVA